MSVIGLCMRVVGPRTLLGAAAATGVLGVAGFAQAALVGGVALDLETTAAAAAASVVVALGLGVPVGALGGLSAGLRALDVDGAWRGLRAAGVSGRAMLVAVAPVMCAAVLTWGLVSHFVEPFGRARLRDARTAAASRVRLVEGRTARLGPLALAQEAGAVRFAGDTWVGVSERIGVEARTNGVLIDFTGGSARHTERDVSIRFESLRVPVPLGPSRGPDPAERPTTAWARRAPTDDYTRWILLKRSLMPIVLAPVAAGLVPLALGTRLPVAALVGAPLVLVWAAVRLLDQEVRGGTVGSASAAVALLVGVSLVAPLPWLRWRDA